MVGAIQLSIVLGATIGGSILDRFSVAATFIFGTLMLVLAAVVIGDGQRLMPADRQQGSVDLRESDSLPRASYLHHMENIEMEIKRIGSRATVNGAQESFTGSVLVDMLFDRDEPGRASSAHVTFSPSARTNWHTHPLGQTLIVTFGSGRVQRWGGPIQEIHPGDVVLIAPEEKHWHGASPTTAMAHIAIQEKLDGKVVDWLEKVSDEQYGV